MELNVFFVPSDLSLDGAAVERRHIDILRAVKRVVTIPVAVKLAPYFSAVGNLVHQLDEEGADGCVLFNRFYQPDIDLKSLALRRDLELSTRAEIRLPLLWVGILAGKVRGSLAAASGVETADEVVKFLLAGADTVMTTSAQRWLGESGQSDKWNPCLIAALMPRSRRKHVETITAEP